MDKLDELKKRIEEVQGKSLMASDMKSFVTLVLSVAKKHKDELESLSKEHIELIKKALDYITSEHQEMLSSVQKESSSQKKDFSAKIDEVKALISKIQLIKPVDGIDGKDGVNPNPEDVVPLVIAKLPKQEEVTGESIIDKINDLDVTPDKQIDAKHIKNLPTTKGGNFYGGSGIKEIVAGTNITVDNSNLGYPVISSTGGSGGLSDGDYGDITVGGIGTTMTIDNGAVSLAKMADMATASLIYRKTAGSGVPEVNTLSTLKTDLGLTGTNSGDQDLSGLVPYTGATSNLNLGLNSLISHSIIGDATDGIILEASNGTDIGILGAGNTANVTWAGSHNFTLATQDTIAIFSGAGKTLSSASLATYPSLTELSYVKGVTSAIQTQLDAKESALTFSTGLTRATNTITNNLSTGVAGGQTVIGGTAASNALTLSSTSHATKGKIIAGTGFAYHENTNRLTVGTTTDMGYNLGVTGTLNATAGVIFANLSGAVQFGSTSNTGQVAFSVKQSTNTGLGWIFGYDSLSSNGFYIYSNESTATPNFNLYTGGTQRLTAYSTGSMVLNEAGANYDIRMEGDTDVNNFFLDASADSLGIGTGAPAAKLHVVSTTEQLRLGYDTSNYFSTTVGSTGGVTFNAVGTGAGFTFSDAISATNLSGTNTGDQDLSSYLTSATAASTYQPLDTQLTDLSGLSYTGNSLKVVRVNAGETGFELATVSGGGDMVLASAQTNSGVKTFLDGTLGLRNVADTFTSVFTNTNTAARTYTLKDASGTIAFTSDITGTNSGTNTGDQTITLTGDATGSGTGSFAVNVGKINGVSLAGLATGILKNTTTTGVLSIAVAGDFPTLNQNTTGSAATLTTPRAIYGNNFDGSAALTQIIASTYGGTGNGFTKFTGATTAEKTYTLPDANATLLYSGGALGTPSSGTLTNATGLPLTGLVSDTTTALGIGSINLGHASDTTLSRSAAGKLAVEGVDVLTVAGGTLTGNIQLGENTSIDLDPAGSADGKYSGICITGTAGAALAFGDLIYLDGVAANNRWELTDADASATGGPVLIGMCVLAAAANGDATKILLQGQIRADAKFPALTIGSPVYLGETAGAIQTAIPTGADNVIRVVGFALTADEIYFNPSQDHQITVA